MFLGKISIWFNLVAQDNFTCIPLFEPRRLDFSDIKPGSKSELVPDSTIH